MSEENERLVYHSQSRRHVRSGCLPLFLLLALLFVVGVLWVVRVEMKPPLPPADEGNILYREDELLETQIRQRSPLPLRLPRYIAPLRQDEGVVNLPLRRVLGAAPAPEELPYPVAADSVVLNPTSLLELPPAKEESSSAAPEHPPVSSPPAPQQVPALETSPLYAEPASVALPGKEVA